MGFIEEFFTYETPKSVVVKSWTVGIINRLMQLLIMIYFIGYVFLHQKAYQTKESRIESTVMTKVKGFGISHGRDGVDKIFDVADYVIPPQGGAVFTIVTSTRMTENQVQGKCAEDPEVDNSVCNNDDDCAKILGHAVGSGKLTGKCVNFNQTVKTCQVQGWCPVELGSTKKIPMIGAENFTIFIKNSIRFPLFNFSKGNMLPSITIDHIRRCIFDSKTDLFCPIFHLGNVIADAGESLTALTRKGGVLGIRIEWKCNLDWSADHCVPRYTFHRLDKVSQTNNVSQGYNFRYARFYRNSSGTEYRTLLKAYGIRIDITVYGQASKFDIIPTVINMVAAFTSVGLGAVVCDLILLNFIKGSDKYKAKKFEEVGKDHEKQSKFTLSSIDLYKSKQTLALSPEGSSAPSESPCK